ncbi:MAG TPA: acyclic terpene utilization AtuA family protein [Acidimicrobiales bacterium]|nr:acyclic terpene utilization AtuA family protein [Acidimicrobiales bacterium]
MGPVRVANCSGFYGDRLGAAAEMVSGGPIDVLTGDWLAELTMLILWKNRLRDPAAGFARSFLTQMEAVLGTCLDRSIKVVSNAGGLAPARLAEELEALAARLGLSPVVAYVEGDDLLGRLDELRREGVDLANLDTGEPLGDREVLTANAYLGGFGIADALGRGADVVVTGRVTDAALVVGPAAWHHGWARSDYDALAGAVVAGHVIECGTQATGGNYAFFEEVPGLEHLGFPIAEVEADGSSVITKHPGQGGLVSVETVTAQLLYEIGPPGYANPDVTARFDTIELAGEGPDRVRIRGVRGEPPPARAKVAMNYLGGVKTTLTMMLTGLDVEQKAAAFEAALWGSIEGGRKAFDSVEVQLVRTDQPDPPSNEAALASLRVTVRDRDGDKVGRAFTAKVTELALGSYPGLFGGGSETRAYGVYWPAAVPATAVREEVVVAGERRLLEAVAPPALEPGEAVDRPPAPGPTPSGAPRDEEVAPLPLGRVAGARSGDKGGNANLGVWARHEEAYEWLVCFLTTERLRQLLPEAARLEIDRYELANLRAVNFVLHGLLGEGVASSSRPDAQAKGLGEYLRAKVVPVPLRLHPAAVA